jgi:hypothetical protein
MIASQERTIAMVDAWLAEMKDGWEKTTACQEATESYPEKMESNSKDMEVVQNRIKSKLREWMRLRTRMGRVLGSQRRRVRPRIDCELL